MRRNGGSLAFPALGVYKWVPTLWRAVWQYFSKTYKWIFSLTQQFRVLAFSYLKEIIRDVHESSCTRFCIEALLVMMENWKWLKCPTIRNLLCNSWFIQIMKHHETIKTCHRTMFDGMKNMYNICYIEKVRLQVSIFSMIPFLYQQQKIQIDV